MSDPIPDAASPRSTIRRDIVSAYLATGAKVGSWVVVLGLVYRFVGSAEFAMLSLVRGTLGILNYATFGLAPAMIRLLAEVQSAPIAAVPVESSTLSYRHDPKTSQRLLVSLHSTGLLIALICGIIGALLTIGYAQFFVRLYTNIPLRLESLMPSAVALIGIGAVLRLISDAQGSILQASSEIARDNLFIVQGEILWVLLVILFLVQGGRSSRPILEWIGLAYLLSGLFLFLQRSFRAQRLTTVAWPRLSQINSTLLRRLLAFGSLVWFAQLADFLYSPCDYVLISRLLGWQDVAAYTPAMQIDSGLLLLVSALGNVLLPKAAVAHAGGDWRTVRRYYWRGTFASAGILLAAALAVWLLGRAILVVWLGQTIPATLAILPLVLIHTVVGGSSAVGRSILIGMGRAKAFSIAAIIAGATNVILSFVFVRYLHLGLRGIVYGTIVAVVGRCAIWMPWYVMRTLRRESGSGQMIVHSGQVLIP